MPNALIPWGVAGLLLGVVVVRGCETDRLRAQLLTSQFRTDSALAAADTQKVRLLGALRLTSRRAVQMAQKADSVDQLLQQSRKALVSLAATVRPLDTVLVAQPATVDSADSLRTARFNGRYPPYTITAEVQVPRPPVAPTMRLAVLLDTIPLGVRIGCTKNPGKAPQSAQVAVGSPIWAQVNLVALTTAPEVCNAALVVKPKKRVPWWGLLLAGAIGWEVVR